MHYVRKFDFILKANVNHFIIPRKEGIIKMITGQNESLRSGKDTETK